MVGQALRWAGIAIGTSGWVLYPFAMWKGIMARWLVRCEYVPITGEMNSCHNDYLPVPEMLWTVIAWLLTPVFFRLALGLLAPRFENRLRWPVAGTHGDHHPMPAVICCCALGWAIWNLVSVPLEARFVALTAYWSCMCLWFFGALGLYWTERPAS